jgi:hypothetical protein
MSYGLQATYLSTPSTYQPSCNLPINYLMFLLTYITNDMKLKNLINIVNFEKCNPLIRTWIIIGEVKGSILNTWNLYTCLKG